MPGITIAISITIFVVILMFFPLVLQFVLIQKCQGRILAIILSKGKDTEFKLLKKIGGEFVKDKEDQWILDPTQQRLGLIVIHSLFYNQLVRGSFSQ